MLIPTNYPNVQPWTVLDTQVLELRTLPQTYRFRPKNNK